MQKPSVSEAFCSTLCKKPLFSRVFRSLSRIFAQWVKRPVCGASPCDKMGVWPGGLARERRRGHDRVPAGVGDAVAWHLEHLVRPMSAHPCEARRYLGVGVSEGGGGHDHLCPDPIAHRATIKSTTGERLAVAYLCPVHAAELVAVMHGEGGTPAGMAKGFMAVISEGKTTIEADEKVAPLGSLLLSPYQPRSEVRKALQMEGVGR